MKKIYLLAIMPFVFSLICLIGYQLIGSEVTSDGILHEPFFLIPLTFLFLFIGLLSTIVITIKNIIKKQKR